MTWNIKKKICAGAVEDLMNKENQIELKLNHEPKKIQAKKYILVVIDFFLQIGLKTTEDKERTITRASNPKKFYNFAIRSVYCRIVFGSKQFPIIFLPRGHS